MTAAALQNDPALTSALAARWGSTASAQRTRPASRRRASVMGDLRDSLVLGALSAAPGSTATPRALLDMLGKAPGATWNARKVARALGSLCTIGRARRAAYGQYVALGQTDTQAGHSDSQEGQSDSMGGRGYGAILRLGQSEVTAAAAASLLNEDGHSDTRTPTAGVVQVPVPLLEELLRFVGELRAERDRLAERLNGERPRAAVATSEPPAPDLGGAPSDLGKAMAIRTREAREALMAGTLVLKKGKSFAAYMHGVEEGLRRRPDQVATVLEGERVRVEAAELEATRVRDKAARERAVQRVEERDQFIRDRDQGPDPEAAARIRRMADRVAVLPKVTASPR